MMLSVKQYSIASASDEIRRILREDYGLSAQTVSQMISVGKPMIVKWVTQYQDELPTHQVLRDVAADLYEFMA